MQTKFMHNRHAITICDFTTGHTVYSVAFCDSEERAVGIVTKLNSYQALVEVLSEYALLGAGKCTISKTLVDKAIAELKKAEAE